LDWGENFPGIVAAADAAGVPLDDLPCIASRVDPEPHLLFEWGAFGELRSDRPTGLDRGAIPWTSIHHFATRHAIDGDDFEHFHQLIRAMDQAELAHLRTKPPDAQP